MQLDDKELFYYLRLIRSKNIGPRRFAALIEKFGSARRSIEVLENKSHSVLPEKFVNSIELAPKDIILRELECAKRIGAQFITINESKYPSYLKQIDNPPPLITVKGNINLLKQPILSMVGSRNASAMGQRLSYSFAKKLGEAGFVICSGFARGIDAQAHFASIKTGTIAVVAGGIDHIYPSEHEKLYHEILSNKGIIFSEMPLNWQPRASDFPRRNRLISGLSLGLLVIEASKRSGSLITANFANEAGRIVFAIPGSPLDPRAKGPNMLIKDGACLVDEPNDIIEILSPLTKNKEANQIIEKNITHKVNSSKTNLSNIAYFEAENDDIPNQSQQNTSDTKLLKPIKDNGNNEKTGSATNNDQKILEQNLSVTPITIDYLSQATQIPVSRLYLALMELDLSGRLMRHSGGMVSLIPKEKI